MNANEELQKLLDKHNSIELSLRTSRHGYVRVIPYADAVKAMLELLSLPEQKKEELFLQGIIGKTKTITTKKRSE